MLLFAALLLLTLLMQVGIELCWLALGISVALD